MPLLLVWVLVLKLVGSYLTVTLTPLKNTPFASVIWPLNEAVVSWAKLVAATNAIMYSTASIFFTITCCLVLVQRCPGCVTKLLPQCYLRIKNVKGYYDIRPLSLCK